MCKTHFDSQGMILNGFLKIIFQNTLMARETHPPFMANAILNFNSSFFNPFLKLNSSIAHIGMASCKRMVSFGHCPDALVGVLLQAKIMG